MLATMSMGLVDLMMLGRIGAEALASLSLAITWWVAVGVFSRNICRGLEPLSHWCFGAERHGEVRNWLLQGLYTTYLWIPLLCADDLPALGFDCSVSLKS